MKIFLYNEPIFNEKGYLVDSKVIEITEKEILDQYWDSWKSRMIQKFGLCHKDITQENCIDEWVVVHWAWEKTD
jgi:hypothetical protein